MIYIVEDDISIRELEEYALSSNQFSVKGFDCAQTFWKALQTDIPDLVILDVMLPGEDGYSILKRLRQWDATAHIPVIMVTAKSAELDKVKGLDGGADDYLTKPFGIMEFISRVKAALRRSENSRPAKSATLRFNNISIDDSRHEVFVSGQIVDLTYKEYSLLKLFLQNPEVVLSRDRLLHEVWGVEVSIESRTVDMHIRTLRQKLGNAGSSIRTVRKVGYMITALCGGSDE